jgi:hypothetical protein
MWFYAAAGDYQLCGGPIIRMSFEAAPADDGYDLIEFHLSTQTRPPPKLE